MTELLVMARPVAAYRALAAQPDDRGAWVLLRRPFLTACLIGAFVSFTTTGRLVPVFFLDGLVSWSFLPALQMIVVAVVLVLVGKSTFRLTRAIDLFFVGMGPWWLWLLGVSGWCLVAHTKGWHVGFAHDGWVVSSTGLGTMAWSAATTFGFFRGALAESPRRAAAATLLYSVGFWGVLVGYLVAVEVIQRHRLGI